MFVIFSDIQTVVLTVSVPCGSNLDWIRQHKLRDIKRSSIRNEEGWWRKQRFPSRNNYLKAFEERVSILGARYCLWPARWLHQNITSSAWNSRNLPPLSCVYISDKHQTIRCACKIEHRQQALWNLVLRVFGSRFGTWKYSSPPKMFWETNGTIRSPGKRPNETLQKTKVNISLLDRQIGKCVAAKDYHFDSEENIMLNWEVKKKLEQWCRREDDN